MNTHDWLRPGLVGNLPGGMVVASMGFASGGWIPAQKTDRMAQAMAAKQVAAADRTP